MYCAGNPIIFIDPDGKRIDEWDYDINTKQMVWVSDKGGSERQYVNVINNGEQIGEGSVSGNQVFVYKLRDAVVLTNKDQNFDDQNYNRNNEYEYTTNEFNIRMKLFEKNSPFKRFIQGEESNGKAPPLSYSEEEKLYGYTNMKLRMIGMAISLAFDVMPSPVPSTPTSNFKSSKISSTGAKYSSTSSSNIKGHQGVKALSGSSSWNKFLQANKGVYSGQGWQKRAAEAYYKSSYYRP